MSHYDEVNRQQRAGEDQAERLWERRQDALRFLRYSAVESAQKYEPLWGIQCPLNYIIASTIAASETKAWTALSCDGSRDTRQMHREGFTAVQITAENAKRIEDFSDGSVPTEKWVQRDDGAWEVVPV